MLFVYDNFFIRDNFLSHLSWAKKSHFQPLINIFSRGEETLQSTCHFVCLSVGRVYQFGLLGVSLFMALFFRSYLQSLFVLRYIIRAGQFAKNTQLSKWNYLGLFSESIAVFRFKIRPSGKLQSLYVTKKENAASFTNSIMIRNHRCNFPHSWTFKTENGIGFRTISYITKIIPFAQLCFMVY